MMLAPRFIAFYLPQFYPTKENDDWWQKGFTEWTNVGKATSLFRGHYQPRVPADLGYYDLRIPEVRVQQAQMAKEAGIEGFCYWHYWFNGKRLLDRVFREVVETGEPDFPFCLCWANHSWYQKTWDPTKPDKLLIEQTYPGEQDYVDHFNAMLHAFKDDRYIRVDGKLLFGIYAPNDFPDFHLFKNTWNELAKINGLNGFYFFAYTTKENNVESIKRSGYDLVTVDYFTDVVRSKGAFLSHVLKYIRTHVLGYPMYSSYSSYVKYMDKMISADETISPCLLPNYDHTPRSGKRGLLLNGSTPQLWGNLLSLCINKRREIKKEKNIVFIKAWNEWAEGNYLEPDLKYGRGYLEEMKKAIHKNIQKIL